MKDLLNYLKTKACITKIIDNTLISAYNIIGTNLYCFRAYVPVGDCFGVDENGIKHTTLTFNEGKCYGLQLNAEDIILKAFPEIAGKYKMPHDKTELYIIE